MLDSDPISEGTPNKRRRLDYTKPGRKITTYTSDDDSADELFDDYQTIPTQPLSQYPRPTPSQTRPAKQTQPNKPMGGIFAQTMQSLQSTSPFQTQPTQPLAKPLHGRSSSDVIEVPASSPLKLSPARPISSMMAPPGTAFRRPGTVAAQAKTTQAKSQDIAAAFDDPPIMVLSDDEEEEAGTSSIKRTVFVHGKGAGTGAGGDSQDSASRLNVSRFAYRADDMSSAYGTTSRKPRPSDGSTKRQAGPAKAQPVELEMELSDIHDSVTRDKVNRMSLIVPESSISKRYHALLRRKGHVDDACADLIDEEDGDTNAGAHPTIPIDLAASDGERNNSPSRRLAPKSSKHEIHATQSIKDKYSVLNKQQVPRAPTQVVTTPPVAKRRKLVKGRRNRAEEEDEADEDLDEGIKLDKEVTDDSDVAPEHDYTETDAALLKFFNECSSAALADLANERVDVAEFLCSHRPFNNLDEIRAISQTTTTKTGRKGTRKNLGEKLLAVCEDMWEGYEAVDRLVEECQRRGAPILETTRKWTQGHGQKDGELDMTKLDDPHDSGIGTPSSLADEDAIISPIKKGRGALLKQPEIMSKDLVMKDYQVTGLNWLNLLWSKRLSCILADDMGLGKTCQVISFFAHLKETETEGTYLVIVPGSTIENWGREFERFCPAINVQAYYGSQAERELLRYDLEANLDLVDVLLTTYDIATKEEDNKFLRKKVKPRVCVFDEGHMLKNAESSRHKELSRFRPEFRVLLTGTPLQNNLQELISLLGFIMPDVFKDTAEKLRSIFKNKATIKDSTNAALLSTQRIQRARAMLTPFILRRKKAQVLSILPAKIRRVQHCDMVPAQAKIWRRLIRQARNARIAQEGAVTTNARARKAAGAAQSVHMTSLRFAALHPLLLRRIYTDAKLRQLQDLLINHPRSEYRDNRADLVWKLLTQDIKGGDFALHRFCAERADFIPASFTLQKEEWMTLSGKIPVLQEMLTRWTVAGSRALIFSQFTTMLDVLEAVLETMGITPVRLDGSTSMQDRQTIIDRFTADNDIKVFLLSTKAGGAGINLAAADKVVIMEGGFNPQDEIQAENRAHRVGQEREVEVVRLVTRGTVEEVILRVGEVKMRLDEAVHGDVKEGEAAALMEGMDEGMLEGDGGEKNGERRVEDLFYKQIEKDGQGGDESSSSDESTAEEEEGAAAKNKDAGDSTSELSKLQDEDQWEDRPRTRGARTGRQGPSLKEDSSREEEDSDDAPARGKRKRAPPAGGKKKAPAAVAQGQDIGSMFRKGLRRRGLDVGQ